MSAGLKRTAAAPSLASSLSISQTAGAKNVAAGIVFGARGPGKAGGDIAAVEILDVIEAEIEERISARLAARQARDFAAADRIRAELAEAGVQLKDQGGGRTIWRRG